MPSALAGELHDQFAERNEGGLEKHLAQASLVPPYELMHTDVILERLWESESSIGPDYVKRRTEEVVIRVVAEVGDDDGGDRAPVTRSRGYLGIVLSGWCRRTRVYLE